MLAEVQMTIPLADQSFTQVSAFYRALSTVAFTLIGLWWIVLQFRHDEWAGNLARRRENYLVLLGFLLPGAASFFAAVADQGWIWRSGFAAAGVVGLLAMTVFATAVEEGGANAVGKRVFRFLSAPVYAAVVAIAITNDLPQKLGIDITPRELEALLATVLIVFGVQIAWLQFSAPVED